MCSGKCINCVNYSELDDYCEYFDDYIEDGARINDEDGFESIITSEPKYITNSTSENELYINDLIDVEEEIATRNASGTSLESLKNKFPDKNFI